jgi:signal transduction histidine kinase
VKFTGTGDRIEVVGEHAHHEWRVQVRDSGSGMAPETARRMLTGAPGQGTSTGTGLGLAIVRAVVESLRGQITVDGEPGRGTTITLRLPSISVSRPPRPARP